MEGTASTDRDCIDGRLMVTSRAELSATIWRMNHPPRPAPRGRVNPGKVIAARMDHAQTTEMAEQLRKDGVECAVNRV